MSGQGMINMVVDLSNDLSLANNIELIKALEELRNDSSC